MLRNSFGKSQKIRGNVRFFSTFSRENSLQAQKFHELQRKFRRIDRKYQQFFHEDFNHFNFEYERYEVFSKKKFESCRAFYRDLREFRPKHGEFFEELLTNSRKLSAFDSFLYFKENINEIQGSLQQISNEELIFLLFLSESLGILPEDFVQGIYESLKIAEFDDLKNNHLKKLIESYGKINYSQENVQNAILSRIKREIPKENVFSLNKIHEFLQGLSLLCAWKYEETRFFHEFFLEKLEKYLEKSQFVQRKSLKFLWNMLETLILLDSPSKSSIISLKNRLPFHKKFLFQSRTQHFFNEILKEICKENSRDFSEEKRILCYFVDFFIEPDKIIEINGPFHYVNFSSKRKWGFDEVRISNLKRLNLQVFEFSLLDLAKIDRKNHAQYVKFNFF